MAYLVTNQNNECTDVAPLIVSQHLMLHGCLGITLALPHFLPFISTEQLQII